jgi:hypothetical protein
MFIQPASKVAQPLSDCATSTCVYLPLVGNPAPVSIFESRESCNRSSDLRFSGDVITVKDKPIYDVVVEVRNFDPSDQLIEVVTGPTLLKATLPGQLNPFDIYSGLSCSIDNLYQLKIIDWSLESEQIYRNATIVSITYEEISFNLLEVTVEIRNDETRPLLDVKGVIWSLEDGNAYFPENITDILNSGEIATFSDFLYHANNIDLIRVSAQGILQPLR